MLTSPGRSSKKLRGSINGETVATVIDDYSNHIRKTTVLVWDNASPHTCGVYDYSLSVARPIDTRTYEAAGNQLTSGCVRLGTPFVEL